RLVSMSNSSPFCSFHPDERYTTRIKNILTEYPDGSQILREILQNSDDAKSTVQTFILDHNTYPTEKLCDPRLDRYQGPALLAINNSIFQPDDFKSLLSLANSEKRNKFDKIGVMGIGFNSIFHITDVCSIVSGSSYVLIDPHAHGYCNLPPGQRGFKADFVEHDLVNKISFYELKKGRTNPELLYQIDITNAKEISNKRKLLANNIMSMITSPLTSGTFETTYRMNFCQSSNQGSIKSEWLIINYIADLNDEHYMKFKTYIRDCKFVPNVGLAVRIDDVSKNLGKLYCFLPLPGNKDDFSVSINGCFAVSKNRRHLEVSMDDDLAPDDLLRLKGAWNKYLFEKVIPIAWEKLLSQVAECISFKQIYTLWPIPQDGYSRRLDENSCLWANLLQNVVNQIDPNLYVFRGPSKYLSINNGYLTDKTFSKSTVLSEIMAKLEFPIFTNIPDSIVYTLEQNISKHKTILKYITPEIVCEYLHYNLNRLNFLYRQEKLILLEYALMAKDISKLYGLPLLPVGNRRFATFGPQNYDKYFIASKYEHTIINVDHLGIIVDTTIGEKLLSTLQNYAENNVNINVQILSEVNFANLIKKSLQVHQSYSENYQGVIMKKDKMQWIYNIWNHLQLTDRDLQNFSDIYLLPIENNHYNNNDDIILRKLNATPKCLRRMSSSSISFIRDLTPTLTLLGSTFVDIEFEKCIVSKYESLKNYVIEINNVTAVLLSLKENHSFPLNITRTIFSDSQKENLTNYIGAHLRYETSFDQNIIDVIKYIPIFKEINKDDFICIDSLNKSGKRYYLLPKQDELSCGLIISPYAFLDAHTSDDIRFILEKVIQVKRLEQREYWKDHVISYLDSQSPYVMDQIIVMLFEKWNIIKPFLNDLSQIKFVKTCSDRKSPIEIFDPDNERIKILFFSDEPFFPKKDYPTHDYLFKLRDLGMKGSMTGADVVDRIENYKKMTSRIHDYDDFVFIHDKSLLLLKYIDDHYEELKDDILFKEKLQTLVWIPTFKPEPDNRRTFSKVSDCRDNLHQELVSYTIPIVDVTIKNKKFRQFLGWDKDPPTEIVINQLLHLLNLMKVTRKESKHSLRKRINANYEHLNNIINRPDGETHLTLLKQTLSKKPWIMNDLDDYNLYFTEEIVFSLPKFIPNGHCFPLSYHNRKNYSSLFEKLGVRKTLKTQDFIQILQYIDFKDPRNRNNIMTIIDVLSKSGEDLTGLLIPNMRCQMVDYKILFFDDMGPRVNNTMKNFSTLAHSEISKDLANRLQLKNLSETLLKNMMFDFGQNEKVTTRLKNILRVQMIFREFLQNADDAYATRFCVILDDSEYSTDSLLNEEMKCWQGPAIWIYNDEQFTDNDFNSLCNLGNSHKWSKQDKIGKFGVGFNSCYHFTDVPQVISKSSLIMFDSQRKYLNSSGARFDFDDYNENHVFNKFEDQFEPFRKIKGCGFNLDYNAEFKGTLFRLPLRQNGIESAISDNVNSIDEIIELLNILKKDAMSELIFLRNVKSFEVFRKTNKETDPKLLWKVEVTKNNENRKLYGKESQIFKLDVQFSEQTKWFSIAEKKPEKKTWLISSGKNDFSLNKLGTWGGVAVSMPEKPESSLLLNETTQNGKFYSYLSLSIPSGLTVNLHASGWALSSDRRSIVFGSDSQTCVEDDAKATQNKNILDKILPELHVKLFEKYLKIEETSRARLQKSSDFQGILRLWPIPANKNPEISKYGLSVIQLASKGGYKIFWSTLDGGTYVNFNDCVFLTKKTPPSEVHPAIISLLHEQGRPTVLIDDKHLEELESLNPQKADSPFIRNILKNNEFLSNLREEHLFIILRYILEDKKYDDLENIPLVPLFGNQFGKFDKNKAYYTTSKEEYKLFHKAGPRCFIPTETLKAQKLLPFFNDEDFCNATNIKKFGEPTINGLLNQEIDIASERDWNPSGALIPNQQWLDEIWKRIIDSPLEPYSPFPLLEVHDLDNQRTPYLISLKNAESKPLIHHNSLTNSDIKQTLANLGIRFTKHPYDKKLSKYIYELNPSNVLSAIKKYQCVEKKLFTDKKDREVLSQYFCNDMSLNTRSGGYTYILANEISRLPIWKTHTKDSDGNPICKSIADNDAYVVPLPTNSHKEFTFCTPKNKNIYYYDTQNNGFMWTLLSGANAKKREKLAFVRDIITSDMEEIPQDLQASYLKFLNEIFADADNIYGLKDYLKDLKFLPNKHFKLVCARDLYDHNHELFKFIYDDDRFLQNSIQDNSISLKVLEDIGLKRKVDEYTFIRCAEEIANKFEKNKDNKDNSSILRNIKDSAKKTLFYFYDHRDLKFSEAEWNELANIKFVPISKFRFGPNKFLNDLYSRYSRYGGSIENELECFKNLCHPKYVNLAWTQLAFFEDEPPEEILKKYEEFEIPLGVPNIPTIINHLKAIQSTVSKSNDWNDLGKIGSRLIFEELGQIYKKLEFICEEQQSNFPRGLKRLPIFLNGTDPFDSESWVTATNLDLSLEEDFSPKRRAVAEHLTQYQNLLKLAGINSSDIPVWSKPEPKEENSSQLSKSMIELLDDGNKTPFNNVLFNVNDQEIYANSSILICAVPYFRKIFLEPSPTNFYNETYEDIEPDSFRILLRWLYGESLSQAIQNSGKKYDDGHFQIYQDFLIASQKFDLKSIKELIEYKLAKYISDDLIDDNLEKIKELADEFGLGELLNYCEKIEKALNDEDDADSQEDTGENSNSALN
ncbi:16930_t:CDS:2, partial [Cetraspora pellucida]